MHKNNDMCILKQIKVFLTTKNSRKITVNLQKTFFHFNDFFFLFFFILEFFSFFRLILLHLLFANPMMKARGGRKRVGSSWMRERKRDVCIRRERFCSDMNISYVVNRIDVHFYGIEKKKVFFISRRSHDSAVERFFSVVFSISFLYSRSIARQNICFKTFLCLSISYMKSKNVHDIAFYNDDDDVENRYSQQFRLLIEYDQKIVYIFFI